MKLFTGEKQESFQLADQKTSSSNPQIKVTSCIDGLTCYWSLVMIILLIPKMVQGNRELK